MEDDDKGPSAHGPALRALRLSQGWSLVQLAEAVGLHASRISHIENGTGRTTPAKLRLIAKALRVPLAAITSPMFPLEDVMDLEDAG